MQVNMISWIGHNNIGDESYKIAFPKLFPDFNFHFEQHKENADACILGGGDIVNQHLVTKLLNNSATKKVIMSVCINCNAPFDLLKQVDEIYVRDQKSVKILQEKEISCKYMPDVAMCLSPSKENGLNWIENQFKKHKHELYEKKVGLVLNAHLNHKSDMLAREYLNLLKVSWDLARLMDETCASFILFPMSTGMPWDDRVTNSLTGGRCKYWKKNLIVYDQLSVQETLNLVSACDVIISSRLHSSIFSVISELPFIDLTHHDKNKGFLETLGLEENSLSYWEFSYEKIKEKLHNILYKEETPRMKVQSAKNQQIDILKKVTQDVHFL